MPVSDRHRRLFFGDRLLASNQGEKIMDETQLDQPSFDLGTWLGRRQAFSLIASRCSVADVECLAEIREKKLYRPWNNSWARFCTECLGITDRWADTLIRRLKSLGPEFFKLNNFT